MVAHLTVAEGGGAQIPRIYFLDDTKGVTGKVHIGFFGPHRFVPNAGANRPPLRRGSALVARLGRPWQHFWQLAPTFAGSGPRHNAGSPEIGAAIGGR
jgi:hypothetical protein